MRTHLYCGVLSDLRAGQLRTIKGDVSCRKIPAVRAGNLLAFMDYSRSPQENVNNDVRWVKKLSRFFLWGGGISS
jgi:hypothetical protein